MPNPKSLAAPAALALAALIALSGCHSNSSSAAGGSAEPVAASSLPMSDSDPAAAQAFVRPAELAAELQGSGPKPLILHVGFRVLYREGAIPGSKYVGAGSTDSGIEGLKAAVAGVAKDQPIVLYCGCCPWDHCPNMRPAYQALKDMGYTNARALYTPHNLETDWANAGYPLEQGKD